ELNGYVRALHQPILGARSAYDIHGSLAALDAAPDVHAAFGFDPAALSEQQEAEFLEHVARLGRFAAIFDDPIPHIFTGVRADRWSIQLQTELNRPTIGAHTREDVGYWIVEDRSKSTEAGDVLKELCFLLLAEGSGIEAESCMDIGCSVKRS